MRTSRLLLVLCFLHGACGALPSGEEVHRDPVVEEDLPLDDLLLRIAEREPGFGGLFVDADGRLAAYVRPELAPAHAALAQVLASVVSEVFGPGRMSSGTLRILPARFTFLQLWAWRQLLDPLLVVPGVVLLDLDEARNALLVGLGDGAARPVVQAAIAELGIPLEAVRMELVPEARPLWGLRGPHRPPLGGVQVASSRGLCTLGFNAWAPSGPGFVTNSHCTSRRGARDGTVFYQPSLAQGDRIGTEELDPAPRSLPGCPAGRRCRYSDSAFVRYEPDLVVTSGFLAAAAWPSDPSAALRGTLRITGLARPALVGEHLSKVGRTTGLSSGAVLSTCASVNVWGLQQTLLCQTLVSAPVGPGDSGSPVYREVGGGDVQLAGLLWGGSGDRFVFSPIQQVLGELGPLRVCAPGFSC
ncbi:MAG: S1 family peptidase [Myxococcales bacterium]|nr:S1 family peptidase [Myxococcota bacterium]MDW8280738.1 S1 family peptidase [Myxococcales bacterium]